jgi:predicted Zn-dependent protease
MNRPDEMLYLAVAYIIEVLEAIRRGTGENSDPWIRSRERQELKEKLAGARELLAELERDHPDASVLYRFDDGSETTYSVARARATAYGVEAHIMWCFYNDRHAAIDLAERAVAVMPEDESAHCTLAACYAELGEVTAAIEAMERVVSLNPDDIGNRKMLDRLRRQQAERAATAIKPAFSFWHPSTWFA